MTELHDYLKSLGTAFSGWQKYRLVRSEEALEKRKGTFNDFENQIFLRTTTEVREVKKYSYLPPCWVLEKYVAPEQSFNSELVESALGTYEPVWAFLDKNNNPLQPTIKVLEFLVYASSGTVRPMNASERKTLIEAAEQKEIQDFIDSIDTSPLQSQFHFKEAVIMPREKTWNE